MGLGPGLNVNPIFTSIMHMAQSFFLRRASHQQSQAGGLEESVDGNQALLAEYEDKQVECQSLVMYL